MSNNSNLLCIIIQKLESQITHDYTLICIVILYFAAFILCPSMPLHRVHKMETSANASFLYAEDFILFAARKPPCYFFETLIFMQEPHLYGWAAH